MKQNGYKCWNANPNCQAKRITDKEIRKNISCAAYEQKKNCWEIDWADDLKNNPDSNIGFWKGFYNIGCCSCPVCDKQRINVENMIEKINRL